MELANQFFQRFHGLDRAYATFKITGLNKEKNKMEGIGATIRQSPSIAIWHRHLVGETGIGIIPIMDDGTVRWGAIDIDVYPLDLWKLEEEILELKLPLIVCRSKSGGAQCYIFFRDPVDAALVKGKLMEWAIVLGHPKAEIRPLQVRLASKEDCGTAMNMPYFDHLNTSRYAYKNKKKLSAQEFLDYAKEQEIDEEVLKGINVPGDAELYEAPPCLQHLCKNKIGEGARNKGLLNLGVFVKQKYPDKWQSILEEYNLKYMVSPLPSQEVQEVIKSLKKKNYFYTCKDQPFESLCSRQICLTRKFGIGNSKDDIGISLSGLTKITTTPPTWIIAVNGKRIHIDSTEDLVSQASFGISCIDKLDVWPHKVKNSTWKQQMDTLLTHVERVEAPEDASQEGQLWHLVNEFCNIRAQAETREQILMGRPFRQEGYIYFRSPDLLKYLSQRRYRDVDRTHKIWSSLRERGGINATLSIHNRKYRLWALPIEKEEEKVYAIPEVKEAEEF